MQHVRVGSRLCAIALQVRCPVDVLRLCRQPRGLSFPALCSAKTSCISHSVSLDGLVQVLNCASQSRWHERRLLHRV